MELKQLNILLADDDQNDRYFFDKALKELPVSVNLKTVSDGEELMNYLAENLEHLPAILFLDINMPRKNGYECLSEIKNNKHLKDLPVVMCSTASTYDKISQTFKKGANIYIHKPSNFEQLKKVILHSLPLAAENSEIRYILNASI